MGTQKRDPNAMALSDDHIWRDRSELWSRRASSRDTAGRAKRERPRSPLILTGHGVSLRIKGGALTIRNGFTH
jgi:CRISP-associated protein Cas1